MGKVNKKGLTQQRFALHMLLLYLVLQSIRHSKKPRHGLCFQESIILFTLSILPPRFPFLPPLTQDRDEGEAEDGSHQTVAISAAAPVLISVGIEAVVVDVLGHPSFLPSATGDDLGLAQESRLVDLLLLLQCILAVAPFFVFRT